MEDLERAGVAAPLPFGKYLLDAELAQGGMSRVFEARLRGPGGFEKKLVVKQILPQLAQDPSFIELFVREANTLVQMSHPNVVPVYELGVVDGVYFLAMERVHGATVAELLHDGALAQALVAQLGAQICEALRYAHERFGLVHRDVTPRNVMVDGDGHVRLLDFGIAAPSAQTGHGELFGSPGYMSPEQAARQPLSPQSDMFGLGAVLYEALTARRASERDAAGSLFAAGAGISEELSLLIAKLLAHEPTQRPTAAETALTLRTWLARNHPEGVQRELGLRAEQACQRAPQPTRAGDSVRPPGMTDTAGSASPRVTRSIATSQTLAQLIAVSTEALPGRASALSPAPALSALASGSAPALRGGASIRPAARTRVIAVAAAVLIAAVGGAAALQRAASRQAPTARPRAMPVQQRSTSDQHQPASATFSARPGPPATTQAAPLGSAGTARATAPAADAGGANVAQSAALSINATPWATVRLDGRSLGSTPQRALAVRAGNHVLLLDCPPLGRQAKVPLKLAAGDHLRVVVDMQPDPPSIVLR